MLQTYFKIKITAKLEKQGKSIGHIVRGEQTITSLSLTYKISTVWKHKIK